MELYAWDYEDHPNTVKFIIADKMRHKNPYPLRRRAYTSENHDEALRLASTKMSIRQAAERCGLPESTLRSHLRGKHVRGRTRGKIFSDDDEKALAEHLVFMSECGYGLSRGQVLALATELLAEVSGGTTKKKVGARWLQYFLRRWPNLRLVKPRKLSMNRAKSTTKERLQKYYTELERILTKYNIKDKARLIYNMDETGFNCEHTPMRVISGTKVTQAITSCRSATTTVLACGNAEGKSLPPYFILKGKREPSNDVKEGCLPGSRFEVSDSGWSNGSIFRNFIKEHFLPAIERDEDEYCMLLYDGHKSHITVPVIEEARKNKLILFLLPPHTSHLLQPLDVGCFGPMKSHYNRQCSSYLSAHPGMVISRYNIVRIISLSYLKAMTHANLQAAFNKTGVCPFSSSKIDIEAATRPSVATTGSSTLSEVEPQPQSRRLSEEFLMSKRPVPQPSSTQSRKRKAPSYESGGVAITENGIFLKIYRKETGMLQKETHTHDNDSQQAGCSRPPSTQPPQPPPTRSSVPRPPSPIPMSTDEDDDDNDVPCCQCKRQSPPRHVFDGGIFIVDWAQCDKCDHWVHLKICSPITRVGREERFLCPCCVHEP